MKNKIIFCAGFLLLNNLALQASDWTAALQKKIEFYLISDWLTQQKNRQNAFNPDQIRRIKPATFITIMSEKKFHDSLSSIEDRQKFQDLFQRIYQASLDNYLQSITVESFRQTMATSIASSADQQPFDIRSIDKKLWIEVTQQTYNRLPHIQTILNSYNLPERLTRLENHLQKIPRDTNFTKKEMRTKLFLGVQHSVAYWKNTNNQYPAINSPEFKILQEFAEQYFTPLIEAKVAKNK